MSAVWEAIRRKLGNLATTPVVREWLIESETEPVQVLSLELASGWKLLPGHRERECRPEAQISTGDILPTLAHKSDVNFAQVSVTISDDCPLQALSTVSHAVTLPSDQANVLDLNRDRWQLRETSSLSMTVHLASRVYDLPNAIVKPPTVAQLIMESIPAPCVWRLTAENIPSPRVRSRQAALVNIPFTRNAETVPQGTPPAYAFYSERRQLATATETPFEDLALIGVFRQVPIAAVRKLALDEETAVLQMWLKPEALRPDAALRYLTLLIGRRRSTGKIVQTVVT